MSPLSQNTNSQDADISSVFLIHPLCAHLELLPASYPVLNWQVMVGFRCSGFEEGKKNF